MSHKSTSEYQNAVNHFWYNYLSVLEKSAIPIKSRQWYKKHIKAYISAHKNIKLQKHLPAHVDKYLNAKGRLTSLSEWQFRQIADALRLLFCNLIRPNWASGYDWYQWRAFAKELEADHPTLMRDANPSTLVAQNNNPLIKRFREDVPQLHEAFIKTLRVRRMAVQTEKTNQS